MPQGVRDSPGAIVRQGLRVLDGDARGNRTAKCAQGRIRNRQSPTTVPKSEVIITYVNWSESLGRYLNTSQQVFAIP